jgi:hypothetical protein
MTAVLAAIKNIISKSKAHVGFGSKKEKKPAVSIYSQTTLYLSYMSS